MIWYNREITRPYYEGYYIFRIFKVRGKRKDSHIVAEKSYTYVLFGSSISVWEELRYAMHPAKRHLEILKKKIINCIISLVKFNQIY